MNKNAFTDILQHLEKISLEQTDAVKAIIDEFPYFQSARAVYLKGLKNQSSFKYNQELKTTAAYTTDRSILFDFITSEDFMQHEISKIIKQNTAHLKDIHLDIEDMSSNKSTNHYNALKKSIETNPNILDPEIFHSKEKGPKNPIITEKAEPLENIDSKTKAQEQLSSDVLNLGKPLQFNKKETHSFNEWLKLTRFKPIKRGEIKIEPETTTSFISDKEKEKKFQLIDKFIAENPKISPLKSSVSKGNLAKSHLIQTETLMTETLARIYVEQKNYTKAIQSYKILSLKYPEKSVLFANQIKAVQQLQEQNKKK